jgi:hypothetical protein
VGGDLILVFGGDLDLNVLVDGFSDFRSLVNGSVHRFMAGLGGDVYDGRLLIDYSLEEGWWVWGLPTVGGGGDGGLHLIVVRYVPLLGADNLVNIVFETVSMVERHVKVKCDSRTLLVFGFKPTEAQRLRVKGLGVKGWVRACRVKIHGFTWFVEPVIFRNLDDDVDRRVHNVLARCLARFYAVRLFRLMASMNLNPALYDYNPEKIYSSIYSNSISVYRESLKEYIIRTCKLLMYCRKIIMGIVAKAKALYLVSEAVNHVKRNIPRQVKDKACKLILNIIPTLIDKIKVDHELTFREKCLLTGKYTIT